LLVPPGGERSDMKRLWVLVFAFVVALA